ncbi:hypothetical protein AMS68_001339 [Peltaster fructicola]|uniref:Ubiquitin-like domain-containing protein n=1 Tax=Peltaster fructicola TaxID=286661 RepID=A0A6H0XM40_9PEZI|nr:hypothetical protein AMS68_001339 [Peltaster fructicola]
MPSLEAPAEVVIRVKIPPGHLQGTNEEVFTLGSLSTTLTVAALRSRIQTLVPTNPTPPSQRILYGGRALIDDEQSLAEALNTRRDPAQTEYVIHLLVRNGGGDSAARAGSGLVGHPGGLSEASNALAAMVAQSRTMLLNQHAPTATHNPTLPTGLSEGSRPDAPITQANGVDTTGAAPNGGGPIGAPTAQPHRHHHHHHHHPQPHFHQGPHFHAHIPQVPFARPPSAQNPFPRPPSSHGVHISGTGPDGQQFAIHQQTFSTTALPNHQQPFQAMLPGVLPPGFPPLGMPLPGMPQMMPNAGQPPVFTALDRARENVAEMRRMLETMRNEDSTSEEHRARFRDIEQRMQAVNDYIDPLRLGSRISNNRPQAVSAQAPTPDVHNPSADLHQPSPATSPRPSPFPPVIPDLFGDIRPLPTRPQFLTQQTDQTSVYLLSSPQGPHALLFSPQHGAFSGSMGNPQLTIQGPLSTLPLNHAPVPTPTQPAPNAAVPQNEQPGMGIPAQAQADPLAMVQPILGPLWLLIRVLIFAYFLMGADMGWRRPVGLLLIGLGFWLIRLGLFGPNGLVRRWWDGVVHVEDVRDRLRRLGLLDAPQGNAAPVEGAPVEANGNAANAGQAPRPFPTPEELAQRLLREQRQNAPLQRIREQIRPAERALALLVASLWPGVGERYVQTLDRAREEEELARRLLERRQQDEEEASRAQEAANEADKQAGVGESKGNTEDSPGANVSTQPAESSTSEEKHE